MTKVHFQLNKRDQYKCTCGQHFRTKYSFISHERNCFIAISNSYKSDRVDK